MNFSWYAVRCCCEGMKVLGFIKLQRQTEHYAVAHEHQRGVAFVEDAPAVEAQIKRHSIELRRFGNEMAVYSDDKPIEFWRNIAGFVEAVQ